MIVHLHQLSFFCHHGLYEEEKVIGGIFIVNLDMELKDQEAVVTAIGETVNYVTIYTLVKERMMQSTPLLETLVMELADLILAFSPLIDKVSISITKAAAPIVGFQGKVGVTFSKQRQ
ncbi:MAG: dihydroneopterin aldolase [Bacteroidota bacterium]